MDGPAPDTERTTHTEPGGPGTAPIATPDTGANEPVGNSSAGPTAPPHSTEGVGPVPPESAEVPGRTEPRTAEGAAPTTTLGADRPATPHGTAPTRGAEGAPPPTTSAANHTGPTTAHGTTGTEGAGSAVAGPPRFGLAVAALSVGAVGVVVALSTWAAWLLVRPDLRDSAAYPELAAVFQLVLGALWFAVLPTGVLAIIFGLVAAARADGGEHLARAGALLGLLAVAIAVAGAAVFVFVFDPLSGTIPGPLGTYPRFFN